MTTTTATPALDVDSTIPSAGGWSTRGATSPPTRAIPLTRVVAVELRKSFDARAGFWLLCSIGLAALLTTTAIIAWAPREELTYSQFLLAIGMPMTVILPVIAALSVTSEWTQRTGLATFTLVPHRGRVLLAKALASVLVAFASTVVAFAVAALGNLVAAGLTGHAPVWDADASSMAAFSAAITLLLLTGFTFGALIRSSAGAIVAYMLYAFVVPGVLTLLAMYQEWFRDLRPWIDAKLTQDALMHGGLSGDQWAHLAVTSFVWLVVPLAIGVQNVLRAEVK
jgi:ABC-2 type transport system permease protein